MVDCIIVGGMLRFECRMTTIAYGWQYEKSSFSNFFVWLQAAKSFHNDFGCKGKKYNWNINNKSELFFARGVRCDKRWLTSGGNKNTARRTVWCASPIIVVISNIRVEDLLLREPCLLRYL